MYNYKCIMSKTTKKGIVRIIDDINKKTNIPLILKNNMFSVLDNDKLVDMARNYGFLKTIT